MTPDEKEPYNSWIKNDSQIELLRFTEARDKVAKGEVQARTVGDPTSKN